MTGSESGAVQMLERLVRAVNEHDLETVVSCFDAGYVNATPAHPERGFRGREQVRRNWTQILGGVPDIQARVPHVALDGDTVWSEWQMSGTRRDGAGFLMRGVVIFTVAGSVATSARFYLEPVEQSSGDVDVATRRVVGNAANPKEFS
jgi:ketosteroid isomerase-like protein